jgi:hypothetical protein
MGRFESAGGCPIYDRAVRPKGGPSAPPPARAAPRPRPTAGHYAATAWCSHRTQRLATAAAVTLPGLPRPFRAAASCDHRGS